MRLLGSQVSHIATWQYIVCALDKSSELLTTCDRCMIEEFISDV